MDYIALKHSVQIYWESIACVLSELKENQIDVSLENIINNATKSAFKCSEIYGKLIRNSSTRNHYTDCEKEFYNNLSIIIENHQLLYKLQNIVYDNINNGTRFFQVFLNKIGLESL